MTLFFRIFILFFSLGYVTPSWASQKFMMNKNDTYVGFDVSYLLLSNISGNFNEFTGAFVIDQKIPKSNHVDISIETSSVDTGNKEQDALIRGTALFDTEIFKTIVFHSKSVNMAEDNSGHISGELSMKGVTKPVTLDLFRTAGMNSRLGSGFIVSGEIERSDFGMNGFRGVIGNTVTLMVCYNEDACKVRSNKRKKSKARYNH